jgi:hypothetical protein
VHVPKGAFSWPAEISGRGGGRKNGIFVYQVRRNLGFSGYRNLNNKRTIFNNSEILQHLAHKRLIMI